MQFRYLIYAALLLASCATAKDATDSMAESSINSKHNVANTGHIAQKSEISQEIKKKEREKRTDRFAFTLFGHICNNDANENICISPASAECALAMVANGAKGKTLEQILATLNSEDLASLNNKVFYEAPSEDGGTIVSSANSIWVNENMPVKEKFINDNKIFHDAEVANVPFDAGTLSAINDWCSHKTNGKIVKILDRLDENSRMILINALYLKGQWKDEFNKSATADAPFTKADGTVTTVKMMQQTLTTSYNLDDNLRMVSMPIRNSNLNVWFVLPRQGLSISEAVTHLASSYDTLRNGMNHSQRVRLYLPRFKTEYSTSLRESLKALGMTNAFNNKANLKGISKVPLYIDDVLQKTYLKIDEKGAEAAAVTSVMIGMLAMRPTSEPIEVRFDRPFLYIITDTQTDNILFIGKVGNPTE